MEKDNFKTTIISLLLIIVLSGNFEMTVEALTDCSYRCDTANEQLRCSKNTDYNCHNCYCARPTCDDVLCEQSCNSPPTCALECNIETCVQKCNHVDGNCSLTCNRGCHGQQICNSNTNKCSLQCQGENCEQTCQGRECSLDCNAESRACNQTCNRGECTLDCNAESCNQTCQGRECSLDCNAGSCNQTCKEGECTLDCYEGSCNQTCNRNCTMNCHGGHCIQNCEGLNDGSRCHLNCDNANSCSQQCKYRKSQYTKNSISTPVPTAVSTLCPGCMETPLPESIPLSTTSLVSSQPSTMSSITPTRTASTLSSSSIASEIKNISLTEKLVTKFLSTLDRTDVQQDSSLQDAVNLFQNTTDQLKNDSLRGLQLKFITENERNSFIFQMAFALEDFAIKYGQYHLNKTNPQLNNTYRKLVLCIQLLSSQNAKDFHMEGPESQNSINIPSSNFHKNGSVLLGIVYKDLHELLASNPTKNKRHLDTIIMTATMDLKPENMLQNVALNFRNMKDFKGKRFCVFWSGYDKQNPDGWSEKGCHVVESKSNSEETECSCNHMTHFAVLFDVGLGNDLEITKTDQKILKILTYVGIALSITGIILTIICYVSFTDVHQPLSQIRVSLSGSLGASQIIFLAGINATENTGACVTVAALMQYFLMAAFCWMLVEGIYLYLLVVKVYNINDKMSIYHLVSWGLPAVIAAISLGIAAGKDGIQSFVSTEYCWMSSTNNLIWIFVAFVAVIEFVNILLLVRVIKEMATMQSTGDNHCQQIRIGIRACLVMVPLLGVTWLFGLLTPLHKAFVYIFTIFNSAQGFLIFLLHCVRNSQIKDRFKRRMNAIFPAADGGKLSTRTSQVNKSDISKANAIEVQSCNNSLFELK